MRAVLGSIETAAPRRARGGVTATHVWTHHAAGMQGPTKEVRNDVLAAIKYAVIVIIVLAILAFLASYIIPRIG